MIRVREVLITGRVCWKHGMVENVIVGFEI